MKALLPRSFSSRTGTTTIIILYIQKIVYNFEKLLNEFYNHFADYPCPACQAAGYLRVHASYDKYYYTEPLKILRCMCTNCGTTHAIIPSFSLPGTSIGTQDAEEYIKRREAEGQGRQKASGVFSGPKAMSRNHPAVLEKAFWAAVAKAKAIFRGQADELLSGTAWIKALTGESNQPITSLNQYCLENMVNAVCLTRYTIHLFRENNSGTELPHNTGSWQPWKIVIDSW
ncbi:MAG: hypothetical protein ACOC7U_09200 [Spirochaetota bacterium]